MTKIIFKFAFKLFTIDSVHFWGPMILLKLLVLVQRENQTDRPKTPKPADKWQYVDSEQGVKCTLPFGALPHKSNI